MTPSSQQHVQQKYAVAGEDYDAIRMKDPRGSLLSAFDVDLALSMAADVPRNAATLEAGAGTGRFTIPMLRGGFRVTATDVNESLLETLRSRLQAEGLAQQCDVRNENIFQLSFPDAHFDFIYSFHVIPRFESLADQEAAILELARTLKPGGRLLFNYSNRNSLLGGIARRYVTPNRDMDAVLAKAKLNVLSRRGKWMLSRGVLNRLPRWAGRLLARTEKPLTGVRTQRKWDVFVLAEKQP